MQFIYPLHDAGRGVPFQFDAIARNHLLGRIISLQVRIDRLAEAQAAGQPITANGVPLTFDAPGWLDGELDALART